MGKKNKKPAGEAGSNNSAKTPQQQRPQGGSQQPGTSGSEGQQRPQPGGQQGRQGEGSQAQQQGNQGRQQRQGQGAQQQRGQGAQQPVGAWGSKPTAQQQQGGQGAQNKGQQERAPGPQQQQGGWSDQQQRGRGPQQQSGQGAQQPAGAWGSKPPTQQQQGGQGAQNKGQQERAPGPQQQQGGWSDQQQRGRGPQQQSGQGAQQPAGACGSKPPTQQQQGGQGAHNKGQQERAPGPQQQQGGWSDQQQRGRGPQQQSGQGAQQPAGAWSSKPPTQQQQGGQGAHNKGQQERAPGPQQQQGGWSDQQQRGRGPQQQSGQGAHQQGAQQQGGRAGQASQQQYRGQSTQQQGRPQQRGQHPGQSYSSDQSQPPSMEKSFQQFSVSNEQVIPAKAKSCAGVVRGTLGKPGTLEVNYLRLNLDKLPDTAYHYDVTITPDRPKKFLRAAFEQCKREKFGNIEATFDGNKSCYTIERLPGPIDHTVDVPDSSNRTKPFKVEIKETVDSVVDMSSLKNYHNERVFDKPMRAIQVLDVILSGNNHERGVRVGRSFYCRPNQPYDLEEGFEAWTGLFQAALLGEMPLLNVDIAHKSFPRQSTLLEYLRNMNIKPEQSFDDYAFRDVQRFMKGLDIQYDPPANFGATPKRYRILDIGNPSSKLKFRLDDGQEMTVAAYYQSKGYNLRYPHLNCLKVGSTIRHIHLPMELCSIVGGQVLNRKDGEKQVQKMIRFAATSTNKRKEKIMNVLNYFQHNDSPIVRGFGIQIGSHFIKLTSRVLPAPYMEYLNGQTVTTSRGAWRMDGKQFLITSKPPNGHKWAILYEENQRGRGISYPELDIFKKDVLKTSKSLTMNLAADAQIIAYGRNQLESTLASLSKNSTALIFVVLANFGTSYAQVKQCAELKVGILTQCIKENTVRRTTRDRTVFSNILLKVNAKLNGTNHKLSKDMDAKLVQLMDPLKKVMYLGADVTHPSPDQRHIPSVVGVAASHDPFGACYNMQYRLQESKQEHIADMEAIVTQHLKIFHKYQKYYPDQIIYYRDGVSDGQFPIISTVELRAIRNACNKLKINVKLTCIIVVKRHHTRFFPMSQPRDDRDFNNVEPGTVVDQYITHPNEVQFFMVSHQSIQGTARPTRYNVIVDDSKFDINFLQKLTYNLCHLFPRCNRPVSYPAPAYLAHLVAFRGRVYLEGSQRFSNNLRTEYERRLINANFMDRNPMYFV